MIAAPLVLIGLVVAVYLVVRSVSERSARDGGARATAPPPAAATDLARWVAAGLLSPQESDAILAYEATVAAQPPPASPRAPGTPRHGHVNVAEPLGYLGGMLALIGLVLLVARYWPDMATAGRLALSGGGALGFVVAGALVREDASTALARLRWFLWLASSAAIALFGVVLAHDALGSDAPETIVAVSAGAVALHSALLWQWRERPLQQLTCLGAIAVLAGALVGGFTAGGWNGWIGVAAWTVGAVYVVLGLRRVTPLPLLTEGVGEIAVVIAAVVTVTDWPGFGVLFAVATALGLMSIATVPRLAPARGDVAVSAVIGGLALLDSVPSAIAYFAQDAGLVTGLTAWFAGAVLVAVGTRHLVRAPVVVVAAGATALLVGAAVTGVQFHGFAPLFGIATAIGLIVLGTFPNQVMLSVFGALGLLVNVPWAIGWFFPGEGRAPLLVMVTGVLILVVALVLARMGPRFRRELGSRSRHRPPPSDLAPHGM
jgi:hypothetical protein